MSRSGDMAAAGFINLATAKTVTMRMPAFATIGKLPQGMDGNTQDKRQIVTQATIIATQLLGLNQAKQCRTL